LSDMVAVHLYERDWVSLRGLTFICDGWTHDTLGSVLAAETVVQYSLSHLHVMVGSATVAATNYQGC
jgi:hypothetical protein